MIVKFFTVNIASLAIKDKNRIICIAKYAENVFINREKTNLNVRIVKLQLLRKISFNVITAKSNTV
jgi:hypothetical protein